MTSVNTQTWLLPLVCLPVTACAAAPREPAPPVASAPQVQLAERSEAPSTPPPVAPSAPAAPAAEPAASANVVVPPPAAPSSLRWKLEIAPSTMSMAGRAKCRIKVTVTNEGSQNATPIAYSGQFTVDGQPSMGADLAFNGAIEPLWMSLPPKQTAVMEREACEALFPAPGKYTVGYRVGNNEVTAVAKVTR